MAGFIHNQIRFQLADGYFNGKTLKAMLTLGYSPNVDTHNFRSNVTGEISGTGYTAGGVTLTGLSITRVDADDRTKIDTDNPLWTSSTLTADGIVFYIDTGLASTDVVIATFTFTSASSTNGNFEYVIPAGGFFLV